MIRDTNAIVASTVIDRRIANQSAIITSISEPTDRNKGDKYKNADDTALPPIISQNSLNSDNW
jgi:hypothetical protein